MAILYFHYQDFINMLKLSTNIFARETFNIDTMPISDFLFSISEILF